jgi:hypothetical protein
MKPLNRTRDFMFTQPASGIYTCSFVIRATTLIQIPCSDSKHVAKHHHTLETHYENDRSSTMADKEKFQGQTSQTTNNADNDGTHYSTSFKLVAIMTTINLSTMIAALDLVRSLNGRTLPCHAYCKRTVLTPKLRGL